MCSFTRREDAMPFSFIPIPLQDIGYRFPSHGDKLTTISGQQKQATNSNSNNNFAAVEVIELTKIRGGMEATIVGLLPYTPYAMVLQAYNSRGAGPSSPAITATTMEDSEF